MQSKVLIIDDEAEFCQSVQDYLEAKNFKVHKAFNKSEGIQQAQSFQPDLVILDKKLGTEHGFEVINALRGDEGLKQVPVIMLTGCADYNDKIEAFKLGADDMLTKPISLQELEVRTQAMLKRTKGSLAQGQKVSVGNLVINMRTQEVWIENSELELTLTEYKILLELVTHRGSVIGRDQLSDQFLSSRSGSSRTLDVHVTALRKKMGGLGRRVKTIRGQGYMFVDQ